MGLARSTKAPTTSRKRAYCTTRRGDRPSRQIYIFKTYQGSPLASFAFTRRIKDAGIAIPIHLAMSRLTLVPKRKSRGIPRLFVCLISWKKLERVKRFERSTPTLARLCSTPELHPLARRPPQAALIWPKSEPIATGKWRVFVRRFCPSSASAAPAASGLVLRPALVINRCRPAFAPENCSHA
jgi:hypothetical protein